MKNIILIATLLIFAGCSSDDSKDTHKKELKQEVEKVVQKETPKEVVKKVVEEKKAPVKEVKKEPVVKKVVQKETPKEEATQEVKEVAKTTKSGEEIFKACIACHGAKADKAALGKSKIIKGWDAAKVSAALKGYNNGTYGGSMKAIMIGQAGFLNDEEIQAVSEYISKL